MKHYVKLKLFATLSQITTKNTNHIPIKPGTTVSGLIKSIGIKPEEIKLIFINGIAKQLDSKIQNGDRIGIFPPVGGG